MNCIDAFDAIPRLQTRNVRGWREVENDELDQQMDECDWPRTGTSFGRGAGIGELAASSATGNAHAGVANTREKKLGRSENFYCAEGNHTRSGGKPCASTFVATFRPISRPASVSIE